MRISWLSAEEIAAARQALTANGATWESHFQPGFSTPDTVAGPEFLDWDGITEHVARAERVSEIVRDYGLEEARARFAMTSSAIEAATLAAAAAENDQLSYDEVIALLARPIDSYVFYAPFLELLVDLGREHVDRTVRAYEDFVDAYARAMADFPHGPQRLGAVRDGLADFYVSAGKIEKAEAMFERRHDEDRGDVAVALSASRAFLAAGSVSHAVRWLGVGETRALELGRRDLAEKLRAKQESVRKRLS
jgi:tetratricopeptide (TPR) repeat protein